MREPAIYIFGALAIAALACWYVSSIKESKRLNWWAIALAAGSGFALTIAIGINDILCSLVAAALAAIGFALRTGQVDYLRRQASSEDDRISKPSAVASAAVLVAISAAIAASWLYMQKHIFHKQ